jgi:hypothetical protein
MGPSVKMKGVESWTFFGLDKKASNEMEINDRILITSGA